MENLRMRDRSKKPRTLPEIVREDSFAGWIMIAAGLVLAAVPFFLADNGNTPSPIPGLLLVAAGVTLNRFFTSKADKRGSRSRRAVRRFIAMLFVAGAILMLWFPVVASGIEGIVR